MKNNKSRNWNIEIKTEYITAILSILVFILFYGVGCINPSNTDWLMVGGDLSQHYLGWKVYRHSSWQFPFGMMNNIAYPFSESIMFTDSIPLFALIFKVFNPILPKRFQYFGLWGMLCFIIQGVLSCNILKKYLESRVSQVMGAMLIVLSPCMIRRMFWHTSLAGQWILILCIWCLVYQSDRLQSIRKSTSIWGLVGFLAVFIHVYFVPMCSVFFVGFCFFDWFKNHDYKRILLIMGSYFLSIILSMWVLGGFSSGMDSGAPGLAYYSFNLNGFFNPQEWNCILPGLKNYVDGQLEGFSYLGLGIIALFVITCIVRGKSLILNGYKNIWEERQKTIVICLIMFAGSIWMACSNEITLGNRLLLRIPLFSFVEHAWSIFRSTGRLAWPAVYMIAFASIISSRSSRKKALWKYLLTICVVLQMMDIYGAVRKQAEPVRSKKEYQSLLRESFWSEVCVEQKRSHIVMVDKDQLSQEMLYSITDYAMDHNMTINDFYFARNLISPTVKVAEDFAENPSDDSIYIFSNSVLFPFEQYSLYYYTVDGMIVGLKSPLGERKQMEQSHLSSYHIAFDGNHLIDGEDRDGKRYLSEHGVSYGPFLKLGKGRYDVMITGKNIDKAVVEIYASGGENVFEYETKSLDENKMQLSFEINEPVNDWEINVHGAGDKIELFDICLERAG